MTLCMAYGLAITRAENKTSPTATIASMCLNLPPATKNIEKLESESILCFIKDENMATTYNYQAAPSIEIQVVDKDHLEAKVIVEGMGYNVYSKEKVNLTKQNRLLLIIFAVLLIVSILFMLILA